MARLTCGGCGKPVSPTGVICPRCGDVLVREGATVEAPAPPVPPTRIMPAPVEQEPACPHCGAVVPDPRHLVCVSCLQPLDGGIPASGPVGSLVLSLGGDRIEVPRGQTVVIGRDDDLSPAAHLFAVHDNVSRRHATAGVDADGAWIRDERSTNGTWVDERRIPAETVVRLADGSVVRLAKDVRLRVGLSPTSEGDA